MKILPIVAAVLLSACGGDQILVPVEVKIPIEVPCRAPHVEKPMFALDVAKTSDKLYSKGVATIAEIEQRKAYETRLEAALKACQ
jgi:hypothetical protein